MRLAVNFNAVELEHAIRMRVPDLTILKPDAQGDIAGDIDALLTSFAGIAPLAELIPKCHGLRWIHVLGTGVDGFPLALAEGRQLTCSRGASAVPIAEWVMTMILTHEKDLPNRWAKAPPAHWFAAELGLVAGKTLGILGFGAIGQALARRALAFDMRVVAQVRRPRPSPMPDVELLAELDALLAAADHLVLALPATPETHHLLDATTFAKLKPGAHLINIARASLVDQEALRAALDSGRLARASLDVVEPEPLPADHWLYSHPRVRLSPHISWCGPGIVQHILGLFLDNLEAFAQGRPLDGAVDVAAGY